MSEQDQVWRDLREQAEEVGIENAASLTTEQLRAAIDERHRGAAPEEGRSQPGDQQS